MNVFLNRIWILKNAGVLPQKLQVLGGFLKEDSHEFCSGSGQKASCKAGLEMLDLR